MSKNKVKEIKAIYIIIGLVVGLGLGVVFNRLLLGLVLGTCLSMSLIATNKTK